MHFYSCPSSPLRQKFLKFCFPQQPKGVEKTMICFIKIQSENIKITWNIRLFIFCIICNFSKCDGFTVLSNSAVLNLLPLLCNHGNLTLKLPQKNSYLNEGWLFIGRFKVGSLSRTINKEVLTQFVCKPT